MFVKRCDGAEGGHLMKYEEEFIVNWCDGSTGNFFRGDSVPDWYNRGFDAIFSHVMGFVEPGQKFKITVKIEPHDDWVVVSNAFQAAKTDTSF